MCTIIYIQNIITVYFYNVFKMLNAAILSRLHCASILTDWMLL